MKKSSIINLTTTAVFGVIALAALPAKADMISYDLTIGNPGVTGVSGEAPPYVTVIVDLTSSTSATITFHSDTSGGLTYLMGGQGAVGVNVNAQSWSLGPITESNAGGAFFTPGPVSGAPAGNEDGFGSFNQTFDSFDGYQHSSDTITITLNDTSGTWSGAANVLTGNASGFVAAAHIFVEDPNNVPGGALGTGYAVNGTSISVPDGGSTMILLGCTLVGLAKSRTWFGRV
jgi:hypothetical protein